MRHGKSEGMEFAGLLICFGERAIQNERILVKKERGVKEFGGKEEKEISAGISTTY